MAENEPRVPATETSDNYYSVLRELIEKVANEPARVRSIVYALAWHHFSQALASSAMHDNDIEGKTNWMLGKSKELTDAIEQLEAEAAHSNEKTDDKDQDTQNAVVLVPEPQFPAQRLDLREWRPPSSETIHFVPASGLSRKFASLAKISALAISFALIAAGAFVWVYATHELATSISEARAVLRPVIAADSAPRQAEPEQTPALPFPIPKTFGIYAVSDGQLVQLDRMPIKIPDPRVQLSAEIRTPSRAVVSNGDLSFLVFRRELVNSAPETVSLRVVARVLRETRFSEGKASVVPVENSWRIRNKAFALKLEPVDRHPDMVLVHSDEKLTLPAGRYALVLGDQGYDFTVAGPLTAREQCLEQVLASNGLVLSECSKL